MTVLAVCPSQRGTSLQISGDIFSRSSDESFIHAPLGCPVLSLCSSINTVCATSRKQILRTLRSRRVVYRSISLLTAREGFSLLTCFVFRAERRVHQDLRRSDKDDLNLVILVTSGLSLGLARACCLEDEGYCTGCSEITPRQL